VVRQILDVVDASVHAAPSPPQERMSWLVKRQPATGLAFRSDGTLLSWGNERKLDHWNDGRPLDDFSRDPLHGRPFAVAADRIATDELHHLKLWDAKSGAQVADLGENTDRGDSLTRGTFSADGGTLAIQQLEHHRVSIWNAVTGKLQGEIGVGHFFAPDIAVSADGRRLAVSCTDKFIRIWDLTTFQLQQEIASEETRGLVFSPDGKSLAAVQGSLILWELESATKRFQVNADSWTGLPCFTPDSATIVCKVGNRKIRLWDARDGRVIGIAEGHAAEITALTISPDGKHIASASHDGCIKVWSIEQITHSK
jgi:WD40 repeat protein